MSKKSVQRKVQLEIVEDRLFDYTRCCKGASAGSVHVENLTERNFGLMIAYLVPGFMGVLALGNASTSVAGWLAVPSAEPATVAGFLFVSMASMGLGVTLSAFRWASLDQFHHRTGIKPPEIDYSKLQARFTAFEGAVHNHYRYYQFYGNSLVVLVTSTLGLGVWPDFLLREPWTGALKFICLVSVLFAASRDALEKYYARTSEILRHHSLEKGLYHDQRLAQSPTDRRASRDYEEDDE